MKPHQMVMDASVAQRIESGAVATVASRTQSGFNNSTRDRRASSEPSLVPTRARTGQHTLILTGELDRGSAGRSKRRSSVSAKRE